MRCLWLLCFSVSLCAQTIDISHLGPGVVSLAGQWKFHPGDNPQWANPDFDDSGWKSVRVPLTLGKQGYPNFEGFGWYRLHIRWNEQSRPPNLILNSSPIRNVAEIFANGVSIGRFGSFPPHARIYTARPMLFGLGRERWSHDGQILIAIRVWKTRTSNFPESSGLFSSAPELGLPTAMQNRIDALKHSQLLEFLPEAAVRCFELALAIYLLALAFTKTPRSEYTWLGLAFCTDVIHNVGFWIGYNTFLLTATQVTVIRDLTTTLFLFFSTYGLWKIFGVPVRSAIQMFFVALSAVSLVNCVIVTTGLSKFWFYFFFNSLVLFVVAGNLILLTFLVQHSFSRFGEARWLAVAFGVSFFIDLFSIFQNVILSSQRTLNREKLSILEQITELICIFALGYLLTRRFGQAQAEGERLHTEMRAAQEIQSLLLPRHLPYTTGFDIDAAYLPAQEVGGDFFQIATASDGSLLMAIGDVSGKGLRAALTVSLVVGLWKEITASISSPAEILARLNRQLEGSMKGGFVTCLCAHLASDGRLTIANAGHLAPYLNSAELVTKNGLPLGVTAQSEYEESHHLLSARDTLVFVSDGVVEARDRTQSFFGFERLQQILSEHLKADAIARRAQQFGQEDDITVISISRQAVASGPVMQTQVASTAL